MDFDKLERANKLKDEIKELNDFIFYARRVWESKLTIKERIMRFITGSYGAWKPKELKMNTTIKNRVLDVLVQYRGELEEEFKSI